MVTINFMRSIVEWIQQRLLPYDTLPHNAEVDPGARRAALALITLFLVFGGALIGLGLVDNKPTTASSGLVAVHRMVTMNFSGWFAEGIWWRGQQTPTPLPFTLHGVWFALFGYSVRGILLLHLALGALSGWLLHRITARRFGSWSGVLAMLLYFTTPLCLYVVFSGWTFVWATLFLLWAIDLLDRAVVVRSIPRYLLAGLAIGCAGMSRPENYMVAVIAVAFVDIPLRYRASFLALAFAYPLAQYTHNNLYLGEVPGLRILDDARAEMGLLTLLNEWALNVWRGIVNHNFHGAAQIIIVAALLLLGLPRRRFLTTILLYFTVAFFAAYAMRRISFNHEGYYYVHLVLAAPFLAAGLTVIARGVLTMAGDRGRGPVARRLVAVLLVALVAAQGIALKDAWRERVLYRVPPPVGELRDFLRANLEAEDRVALDYFAEVSWMLAEIEGPRGRDAWFYNSQTDSPPRPRINAARKDIRDEEIAPMNEWVRGNFERWSALRAPRFLVTQTDAAWRRERDRPRSTGHYRMFSLRPALGAEAFDGVMRAGQVRFENGEFMVIELNPSAP